MAKDKSKKAYTTKKCLQCHETKDLIDFHLNKKAKDGRYTYCKTCRKQDGTIKENNRIYYQQIKPKRKIYKENNREQIQLSNAEWYKKNKKKINSHSVIYNRNRRLSDPIFKSICNLRNRLRKIMKSIKTKKDKPTKEFLGCSMEALKIYLENQFSTGMSWDNYGKWHLDHIKPCCSFDLTDIEQQKICFHYTNLQPLWAIDNMKKGRKIL